MTNKEIANTILCQLGGSKFIAMTGSKNFIAVENGLQMQLAKNHSKANRLEITLRGDDTYTMRFYKYSPAHFNKNWEWIETKIAEIKKFEGIYCDQLQEFFTEVTWMYTKLF